MFNPKILRNKDEYHKALERLEELFMIDPEKGTELDEECELLSLLIEKYENEHFRTIKVDPIDVIKFLMESNELHQKDMIPYIGSASKVSEVLNRKVPLSLNMIRKLHKRFKISYDLLIEDSSVKTEKEEFPELNVDFDSMPYQELKKRQWFVDLCKQKSIPLRRIKEYGEDILAPLINNVYAKANSVCYNRTSVENFRTKREIDKESLLIWKARVISLALEQTVFSEKKIGAEKLLTQLSSFTTDSRGPEKASELLLQNGIHCIIEPHYPKTYLDGAAFLLKNGTPVIGLTLRYDRLDNFWFTLLHETVHVLYHLNDKNDQFFDDTDSDSIGLEKEEEADKMTSEYLLSEKNWTKSDSEKMLTRPGYSYLRKNALMLGVGEAILAGRIQFDTGNFKIYKAFLGSGEPGIIFNKDNFYIH